MEINMVGIVSTQFAAMKDFYHRVMKLPILLEMEEYVEFKHPGVRFAITTNKVMKMVTEDNSFDQEKKGQVLELAFAAESPEQVDVAYADLIKEGATPIKDPADMPWNQRAAFFADPDGNIHEIFADFSKES